MPLELKYLLSHLKIKVSNQTVEKKVFKIFLKINFPLYFWSWPWIIGCADFLKKFANLPLILCLPIDGKAKI